MNNFDYVDVECYMVVKASISHTGYLNGKPGVRCTKLKPAVEQDEVPIHLTLKIPKALFRRPQLTATIMVPAPDEDSTVIPVEVESQIAEAIRAQTGFSVSIKVDGGNSDGQ